MMRAFLLGTTCFAFFPFQVMADHLCEETNYCQESVQIGKQALDSDVSYRGVGALVPANTEKRDLLADNQGDLVQACGQGAHSQDAASSALPFRISIDGVPIGEADAPNSADVQRCQDVALKKADIQVRFDRLEETQALNVSAYPRVAVAGERVRLMPYSNYLHFITKAEVRIFAHGQSLKAKPIAVLPVEKALQGEVIWSVPEDIDTDSVHYVLRVYDEKGRFDETEPQEISFVGEHRSSDFEGYSREKLIGYGENRLALKNIPVSGGMITINGSGLAHGARVRALGVDVPVDANGRFAYRQILPEGQHNIPIAVSNPDGSGTELTRLVDLPDQDWFYIGLADVTIGKNSVSGPGKLVTGQNSDRYDGDLYVEGRLAFYTKGKFQNGWQLTASADTKEQPIEDLFSNFTEKNPRALLKRLDPNKYYQVYGDDSTAVEDAQTQGKFYVKAEKDDSHVMWGNFQTEITGTDLIDYKRTLYGAGAEYNSAAMTDFGERRTEVDAFAADPGTVPSYEEFRGTGGSLYYLRGQDVVVGSERLRVEVRDRDSGIVLNAHYLTYGQDYEFNYTQGRIILREALESTSSASTIVQTGALSGNPVYLVAAYEYAPSVTELNNLTKGGRVSHWFGDHVKLGASVYDQAGSGLDQTLSGVDATVRYSPNTYLKVEAARSEGAGSGEQSSVNGGFNFDAIDQDTSDGVDANAYRAEIGVDLAELIKNGGGRVNAYALRREDGFSAPGQLTDETVTQQGVSADIPVNDHVSLNAKFDFKQGDETGDVTTGEVGAELKVGGEGHLNLAVRHDDRSSDLVGGNSSELSSDGARTDLAVKYTYAPLQEDGTKERYEVYGIAQATLDKTGDRDRNNRAGLGGVVDVTDKLSLSAEATGGNGGLGALAGLEYEQSDRTSYYINYLMDSERTDIGARGRNSSLVLGGKSRYTDNLSVFSEQRYQTFDNDTSSLIHSFGLDLAASDRWTWGGRIENGTIFDENAGDTERTALSLSSHYSNKKTKYGGSIEYRDEDNDTNGGRDSFLMSNNWAYQATQNWRALIDFDFAFSESGLSSDLNADFIEFGMGYAYRPVDNDRFNALVRYEYLSDLAPEDQLNATRTASASDYEQRSHVLSADAIYDLTPKLAVGGKVGYRFSEIRDMSVQDSDFFDSNALLLIGRVDYHVVKDWELTGELRHLSVSEAEDARTGALLGAYKHINQNVKVGAGYNFTDFSDDLTDLDYDSEGAFFNILGKF